MVASNRLSKIPSKIDQPEQFLPIAEYDPVFRRRVCGSRIDRKSAANLGIRREALDRGPRLAIGTPFAGGFVDGPGAARQSEPRPGSSG